MADSDRNGNAWRLPPSDYIRKRPPTYDISAPKSFYLTMKDGCRLAVDLYLPSWSQGDGPWPTILIQTPYYRRFAVDPAAGRIEASPNIAKYRDVFLPRGYAVVVVDVRGTGASFGTRDIFRSPRERDDAYEIVEWIVAQGWSNGAIGATGISYLGAASDFLASTSHPAVKAIAPLFSVWDTYLDNYYPGGILLTNLADVYDRMMAGLDQDKREYLKEFVYYSNPAFRGPHPVDDDPDGAACVAAVKEHAGNFRMPDLMRKLEFRSEPLEPGSPYSSDSISPSTYAGGVRDDIAIYSVSGWMDGAGYANGAISRFLTLPNSRKFLLLGPWDHGARINCSLWRSGEAPEFDIMAEILRFFDQYLEGRDTGIEAEKPVHYFSVHAEEWRAADAWPPLEASKTLFLSQNGRLGDAGGTAGSDGHNVNFDSGTGRFTRYERIAAIDSREYYTDWHGRDGRMLNYTSAELTEDAELTGHGLVSLWITAPATDFAIHAYLSEIQPDGRSLYVTEGSLRAIHRCEIEPPPHHRTPAVFHPCTRGQARDVTPGEPHLFRFSLLPISWTFSAKSRIRLSLEGADADHFQRIPAAGPLQFDVLRGGGNGSHIILPLRAV
ncbi:CocE/NonD family hydrolase [Bradyrhizobium sp.]|uniref:CocE/NonD family hydrolase n=1 Tax=Bradyrhizobium sp. TaxID=376 RepID=UPI0039E50001